MALILLRHLLGVAAGGLGLLELVVFDGDELGSEALHLLLRRRANVGRGDDGAQPASRCDRLQAGDARSHDEDPRGRDRARRRHHHRQRAAVFGGAVDHGAVTREVGLARKHVHGLRAGNARNQFHREGGDAGIRHGLEGRILAIRIHHRDDQCAPLVARKLGRGRAAHLEHHVGTLNRLVDDGCARSDEFGVWNARFRSGSGLDRDLGPEPLHLLDRVGRRGDPVLDRVGLARYGNAHRSRLLVTGNVQARAEKGYERRNRDTSRRR